MATLHNQKYRPSFPTLNVILRSEHEQTDLLSALLDSGADGTLVPINLLEQLGAPESGEVVLRTHFGDTKRLMRYLIDIQVERMPLPGIYVVADDSGSEVILGRDVLNKLTLFLDGPGQQTELLDDGTASRLRARRTRA